MPKITSSDINAAIIAAKSHPQVSERLATRDNDSRLDCRYIKSEIISRIDNPVKKFRIFFNYEYIDRTPDRPGEDIVAVVESNDGQMQVVEWFPE